MNRATSILVWCVLAVAAVFVLAPADQVQVQAGTVASADGFTLLTGQSRDPMASGQQELVYLVDHRSGMLLVYGLRPDANNALRPVLIDGGPIASLFQRPAPPSVPQPPADG